MGIRIWATCVAILALAMAAATALAAPDVKEDPAVVPGTSGQTTVQLEQALALIGPQDPAITKGLIAGCEDLMARKLTSAPCTDLLEQAGVTVGPVLDEEVQR